MVGLPFRLKNVSPGVRVNAGRGFRVTVGTMFPVLVGMGEALGTGLASLLAVGMGAGFGLVAQLERKRHMLPRIVKMNRIAALVIFMISLP
jgi:hypothetical protein